MQKVQKSHRWRLLRHQSQAGVTLVEVLIVVAIMAMIAAGVTVAVLPKYREAQIKSAETSALTIRQAIQSWQMSNNESSCPTITQLVDAKHIDSAANVKDSWGQDYHLFCEEDEVIVVSDGPDKKASTKDDIRVPKRAAASDEG